MAVFSKFSRSAQHMGGACVLVTGLMAGVAAQAHQIDDILVGGIGAMAGAAIGQHIGGPTGTVVGAAIGGAAGVTLAQQNNRPRPQPPVVQPVYVPPPQVIYQPPRYMPPPPPAYGWREREAWRWERRREHEHWHHHDHDEYRGDWGDRGGRYREW